MKVYLQIRFLCLMMAIGVNAARLSFTYASDGIENYMDDSIIHRINDNLLNHLPGFPFGATVRDKVLDKSFQKTLLSIRTIVANAQNNSDFVLDFPPTRRVAGSGGCVA